MRSYMRQGLGKGLGMGYKNIAPMDSHVHSLSAKGCKSLNALRFGASQKFRQANIEDYGQFMGLQSKPYEGRSFTIDEHDAKMIVANIPKRDYDAFKKEFTEGTATSFYIVQLFDRRRNPPRKTISEFRSLNKERGQHFFDRDAMRFFDSKIETKGNLINDKYFITSEQYHGMDGYSESRKYSVREAKDDGSVGTHGEFNSFRTYKSAVDFAKGLGDKK